MKLSLDNIPFDDQKTWDLICSGDTLGVFQCEKPLAQTWLKKIKPRNIWELSIVIAGIRPGSLKSGAINDYLDVKNGVKEKISYLNAKVDGILEDTMGQILFQEQIMLIGSNLAWIDLPDHERGLNVDILRKAIGKKNQKKILEVGEMFITGAVRNGTTKELAAKIFDVIKNSGRYAFNLSHSISYTYWAYYTAYLKANHPSEFFATYLSYAQFKQDKWDEIKLLIRNAQSVGYKLLSPNINSQNLHFQIEGDGLRYGLFHIKFINTSALNLLPKLPKIDNWQKIFMLFTTEHYGGKLNKNASEALIKTGAFSDSKVGRQDLLSLFELSQLLTKKEAVVIGGEVLKIIDQYDIPVSTILEIVDAYNTEKGKGKRVETLASIRKMTTFGKFDHPNGIYEDEREYLGCPVSASPTEMKANLGTHTCYEAQGEYPLYYEISISAVIEQVIPKKIRNGKNAGMDMASICVSDQTGGIDFLPVFADEFKMFAHLLVNKNCVILHLTKGKMGWIVKEINQN